MLMRRLQVVDDVESTIYRPYLNTGLPVDIMNGKYIPAVDGSWVLSGGAGLTTATIGGPNTFKSTLNNGCSVNVMARFPHSQMILNDTEYAVSDPTRLASFSNLYLDEPEKRTAHLADLSERITIMDPTHDKAENLDAFIDYLKAIRDEKIQHYKDYEVETEILDPETMKPYRMMLPTLGSIDSWTEAQVRQLGIRNEEHTADTEMKEQRMIHMEEGWQKSRLMRQLPSICAKGGIYLFITGHLGKKQSLDGKPVKKDMTYMGQDETAKAMGPKFNFLMSTIFNINNAQKLVSASDPKLSEYPSEENVSGNELQRLMITMVRSKNAPAGAQVQLVSSQRFGITTGLSFYHYLKENKYWGMGTPNKVRSPILGDTNIGRTKIFEAAKDYKIARALELTYQLFMIQSTWSRIGQIFDYSTSIETFADKLLNGQGYAADDILNSRGWWTYKGAEVEREYMSLPNIMMILDGTYKPKFLSASGK